MNVTNYIEKYKKLENDNEKIEKEIINNEFHFYKKKIAEKRIQLSFINLIPLILFYMICDKRTGYWWNIHSFSKFKEVADINFIGVYLIFILFVLFISSLFYSFILGDKINKIRKKYNILSPQTFDVDEILSPVSISCLVLGLSYLFFIDFGSTLAMYIYYQIMSFCFFIFFAQNFIVYLYNFKGFKNNKKKNEMEILIKKTSSLHKTHKENDNAKIKLKKELVSSSLLMQEVLNIYEKDDLSVVDKKTILIFIEALKKENEKKINKQKEIQELKEVYDFVYEDKTLLENKIEIKNT